MKRMKVLVAKVLIVALGVGLLSLGVGESASAAKKTITVKVGSRKKVSVKKSKKATVKWQISNKKIATVKKSGKYAAYVKGVKKGTTKLVCKVKKNGKITKITYKVVVKKAKKVVPTAEPTATPTVAPTETPVAEPTAEPTNTPVPENLESIKDTYAGIFENMGVALNYDGYSQGKQMQTEETMEFVKKHFNSFTLENEMKPDSMFVKEGEWNAVTGASTMSIAEGKKAGYVIPSSLKETIVPEMNFATIDKVLEVAKESEIRMRAHTLLWHQQTPSFLFKENYSESGDIVSEEVMNGRLEFYVRTVVRHVLEKEKELTGEAGSLVYAWDVVNEYIHRSNIAPGTATWVSVYGDMGLEPTYVKAAFEYAYDELKNYGVQDVVALYYNDYDTYFCTDDIIKLVTYINSGEETVCNGIGMQSHVDVDRPTLEEYGNTLDKFLATGLEVSITELDMTINFDHVSSFSYKNEKQTNADQAAYCKDFMEMVIAKQQGRDKQVNPKGIAGITIWGLYDNISWRRSCKPLLFSKNIKSPKESFFAFIEAAKK